MGGFGNGRYTMRCAIVIAALMLAGCTQTKITTPTWSMERVTFLQRTDVPKITVLDDGSIEVEGYNNDGGNGAIAAAVGAAVRGAVRP
jgi:hypothetical protein